MDDKQLGSERILACLKRAGELLAQSHPELGPIEVLLVGGAAGILTGMLRPERTTLDCDVIEFVPEKVEVVVEEAASEVAAEMGLSPNWLNGHALWYVGIMLDGWRGRRQYIDSFGPLKVYAVSRIDLISLKFYAHRDQDIEDLDDLKVTAEEAEAVREHLQRCVIAGFTPEQIDPAIEFLNAYMDF